MHIAKACSVQIQKEDCGEPVAKKPWVLEPPQTRGGKKGSIRKSTIVVQFYSSTGTENDYRRTMY